MRIREIDAVRDSENWSMDFMADELFDGRRFRLLTRVEDFTRKSLAVEVGQRLTGDRVAEVLDRIGRGRDLSERIRVDNGTEFTSKRLDQWAYLNGVQLEFSRRGKPTDNGLIESFNGRLRAECLNENWLLSLDDARSKVQSWRRHIMGSVPTAPWATWPPGSSLLHPARLPGRMKPETLVHAGTGSGTSADLQHTIIRTG
jgi:putative transposase